MEDTRGVGKLETTTTKNLTINTITKQKKRKKNG